MSALSLVFLNAIVRNSHTKLEEAYLIFCGSLSEYETPILGRILWVQLFLYIIIAQNGDICIERIFCLLQPVGMFTGKYEMRGEGRGDCSLTVLNVDLKFDDGLWECQVKK